MSLHKEINFESEICQHLAANGWLYAEGDAANYNRTLALYPADVKTFREVCCGRLEIPAEAFDKKVLLACLPSYYWLFGRLRWHLNRSCFKRDLEIVRAVADCTSVRDIRSEITCFHHQKHTGFQRNFLRFRISGRRLLSFANKFLPQN